MGVERAGSAAPLCRRSQESQRASRARPPGCTRSSAIQRVAARRATTSTVPGAMSYVPPRSGRQAGCTRWAGSCDRSSLASSAARCWSSSDSRSLRWLLAQPDDPRVDELVVTIGQKPSNPSASAAADLYLLRGGPASGFEVQAPSSPPSRVAAALFASKIWTRAGTCSGCGRRRRKSTALRPGSPGESISRRRLRRSPTGPLDRTAETSAAFTFAANEEEGASSASSTTVRSPAARVPRTSSALSKTAHMHSPCARSTSPATSEMPKGPPSVEGL